MCMSGVAQFNSDELTEHKLVFCVQVLFGTTECSKKYSIAQFCPFHPYYLNK
jgi:hypothetical protein